jgi:hypothetical protein
VSSVASKTKVDPELRRQLDEATAAARSAPVEAVLRLRNPPRRSARTTTSPTTQEIAETLFERLADECGLRERDYQWNVFPNLGYAVVSAPPAFIERLLSQPEVLSASANRRP